MSNWLNHLQLLVMKSDGSVYCKHNISQITVIEWCTCLV